MKLKEGGGGRLTGHQDTVVLGFHNHIISTLESLNYDTVMEARYLEIATTTHESS